MYLNIFTFKKETLKCSKCNWVGLGSELIYGDYSEKFDIVDMECPKCFEQIGYWVAPTNEEKEKWSIENPNTETGWEQI